MFCFSIILASSSRTEQDGGLTEAVLAMTQPAEPPPTTMMRKVIREVFWCGMKFMVMTFKGTAERSLLLTRSVRVGEIAPRRDHACQSQDGGGEVNDRCRGIWRVQSEQRGTESTSLRSNKKP
jgi:hypothetical protein